jgi:hypothetical protein
MHVALRINTLGIILNLLKLERAYPIVTNIPQANRSNIYRTLKAFDINSVLQKQKYKEYEPDYLHIDVTYLPKLKKQKYYLFVAIV